MTALVENEDANEYVRAAGMTGLLTLRASGALSRDALMEHFRSLFPKLKRTPDGVWEWVANRCADLWPGEVIEDLRQVYDEDLVDPRCIGWDNVEAALALGKDAAMARLRKEFALVSDVHKEMSWWYCFGENQHPPLRENPLVPEDFPWPEPAVFDPIYRTGPKIRRNEPCTCGSGKKFKKCCGR